MHVGKTEQNCTFLNLPKMKKKCQIVSETCTHISKMYKPQSYISTYTHTFTLIHGHEFNSLII